MRVECHQQGVAIRLGPSHLSRPDRAAGTRLVVDHHGLPKLFLKLLLDQPRDPVDRAARRKWHHQPHRPRRIAIRERQRRCQSKAQTETEDIAACNARIPVGHRVENFHRCLPCLFRLSDVCPVQAPVSALKPPSTIADTAACSSLSGVSPLTPTLPIALPCASRTRTPPATGVTRPCDMACRAVMN